MQRDVYIIFVLRYHALVSKGTKTLLPALVVKRLSAHICICTQTAVGKGKILGHKLDELNLANASPVVLANSLLIE